MPVRAAPFLISWPNYRGIEPSVYNFGGQVPPALLRYGVCDTFFARSVSFTVLVVRPPTLQLTVPASGKAGCGAATRPFRPGRYMASYDARQSPLSLFQ